MSNTFLIIAELDDYLKSIKRHYSFTKGFGIAQGLTKIKSINEVYYLTKGESIKYNNVNLINVNEIDQNFMNKITNIILVREHNILDILEINEVIKHTILNKNKTQSLIMKSDAIEWLWDKRYIKMFKTNYEEDWYDFIINNFNYICCQTEEYKNQSLHLIKSRILNKSEEFYNKLYEKIISSRMGVNNINPYKNKTIINPYTVNHEYCIDNGRSLNEELALTPLCYTAKNYKYSKDKQKINFNRTKTILIYMGRLKTDQGKILYTLRDIMNKLGDNYELHIFPGRFVIPTCPVSVFSNKYGENLQIMRDIIFHSCTNVIIHYPFNNETQYKYLYNGHIGIDFSSTRPHNKKTLQGNAKLLEYCYYGLKVVTEKNVINSNLVTEANNGILLDNIGTVDDYVRAIKNVENLKIDRNKIINKTIENHNWDIIALELFNKIN
tara:strand:- start:2689 stop:4005 length:1317 start_codon:yes stop_codon:yes gene_type:complete